MITISMTTWPPRSLHVTKAWEAIVTQQHSVPVRYVLTLGISEWNVNGLHPSLPDPKDMLKSMEQMGVEVLWDKGNTLSHKKLMPTISQYPDSPILVVDDDVLQREGWLQTFIDDHYKYPNDIIYGISGSIVDIIDDRIVEGIAQRGCHTHPGRQTYIEKPANGAAGTLYPVGTFKDHRFFDRSLYMSLCPTSDETWQWAWAVMADMQYKCLSSHNYPNLNAESSQDKALFITNIDRYTIYHNAIADKFPIYKEKLKIRIYENKRSNIV
jgi:hypothetical protein